MYDNKFFVQEFFYNWFNYIWSLLSGKETDIFNNSEIKKLIQVFFNCDSFKCKSHNIFNIFFVILHNEYKWSYTDKDVTKT